MSVSGLLSVTEETRLLKEKTGAPDYLCKVYAREVYEDSPPPGYSAEMWCLESAVMSGLPIADTHIHKFSDCPLHMVATSDEPISK